MLRFSYKVYRLYYSKFICIALTKPNILNLKQCTKCVNDVHFQQDKNLLYYMVQIKANWTPNVASKRIFGLENRRFFISMGRAMAPAYHAINVCNVLFSFEHSTAIHNTFAKTLAS